jgi:DNA-binding transcriptional LysR family regulator
LTAGGRRLAALAGEILSLAEQARRSVHDSPSLLRVAATRLVAAHIGPLIDAFTARHHGVGIEIDEVAGGAMADLLEHRRADIALGPGPGPDKATIATVPFLRASLIVVAPPEHPLAGAPEVAPAALAGFRWLVGPGDLDPATATGQFLGRLGVSPDEASPFSSHAAAIAAAAAGEGLLLTLAHSVLDEVRRRALVRLDVRGTPLVARWHASTLGLGRALPTALALQRFATTAEATQAISSGPAGRVSARARPAVHVTLWSSVAAGIDAGVRP